MKLTESERQANDNYPTPIASFLPLLPYLHKHTYWEPAAGDRRLINAMHSEGIKADGADLRTEGYDFLKDNRQHAAILTNPPFSLAFEFCQHAVRKEQEVYLLLRLNFLASQKRREWFRAHEPAALFVLSERPKFINGRTDCCDYAWFYWGLYHQGIRHL